MESETLRLTPGLILCALTAAACSAPGANAPRDEIRVTAEQTDAGEWRIAYRPSRPLTEIDLGPSVGGYRTAHWRAAGGGKLTERDGRDVIRPASGANSIREAIFLVEPARADLRKEYEPFIPMGDGGVILYSGHFLPFGGGERLRSKLTIIAAKGSQVSAFDETAPEFPDWESPFDHPAFIYAGRARPVESGAMMTITDATAPQWISAEVSAFAPSIAEALQRLLQRALPARPNIFIAMGDLSEEGRLSYSGDALPGQYQMTLAGGAWKASSPQGLAVLRRATAHEAAHLWQASVRPKSDAVPDWIHEGGADALAAEAMLAAGYWTKEEVGADLKEARSTCARSLEQLSLERAEAEERWDAVYACGHVLNVAAAGEAGVAAFWREFVRRAAADGYDEAMFLALAEGQAGPQTAGAIRELVRINDARPDLVISRMLDGGAPDLAASGAR